MEVRQVRADEKMSYTVATLHPTGSPRTEHPYVLVGSNNVSSGSGNQEGPKTCCTVFLQKEDDGRFNNKYRTIFSQNTFRHGNA